MKRRMEWPDWAALALFAVVIAFGAIVHEPWRDELDPWLRVRDSNSIAQLRAALSHTGHPLLWYALLGLIRPIGVHAIPFLHAAIAVGYAYVLLRFAPFPRWLRVARNHGRESREHAAFWSVDSRLDALQAALLELKLDRLAEWTRSRRAHAGFYRDALAGRAEEAAAAALAVNLAGDFAPARCARAPSIDFQVLAQSKLPPEFEEAE